MKILYWDEAEGVQKERYATPDEQRQMEQKPPVEAPKDPA